MTVKELIEQLQRCDETADVMVVSADMGKGGDTYGPLDDVSHHNLHVLLGCTEKMCGDSPIRHDDNDES